jgi:ParB/RepB/Spo0J family partition protein
MSSIQEKGVIQPVLVRKIDQGYELIAGERRFRAVKALNIEKIPAIVKNVADIDMLEISLIENIQREELNSIEEAYSFQKFITDFGFTQEKIAKVLGKDRSTIANTIRLLGLPKKIQDYISKNTITAGHAKAIPGSGILLPGPALSAFPYRPARASRLPPASMPGSPLRASWTTFAARSSQAGGMPGWSRIAARTGAGMGRLPQ